MHSHPAWNGSFHWLRAQTSPCSVAEEISQKSGGRQSQLAPRLDHTSLGRSRDQLVRIGRALEVGHETLPSRR